MFVTVRTFTLMLLSLCTICFGGAGVRLCAQTSLTGANIVGRVVSDQGTGIEGATITLKNLATNIERTARSGADGYYTFIEVPLGLYEIRALAETFIEQKSRIDLELGTNRVVNFSLKSQKGEETEAKSGVAVGVEGRLESGTALNNVQRFGNLPIFRRNFLEFTLLTPRAKFDQLPLGGGAIPTTRVTFNGQSARFSNSLVDGIENIDRGTGAIRAGFSQGSIGELVVLADSYSAEFGRSNSGITHAATRPGGNEFHGGVLGYISNDTISARDAFALNSSFKQFDQYQTGANVVGPIKKDKVFFAIGLGRASNKQSNIVGIKDEVVEAANRLGFPLRKGAIPFSLGLFGGFVRIDTKLSANDTLWVRYNGNFVYSGAFVGFADFVSDTAGSQQRLNDNTISVSNTYISPVLNIVNETRFSYGRRNQRLTPNSLGPQVIIQDIEALNPTNDLLINNPLSISIFGGNTLLPQPQQGRLAENSYQIANNVTLPKGRHLLKFGFNYTDFDVDATLDLFDRGQAIFIPLDFLGAGAPVLTALQAFDPARRTPQQRAFLRGLAKTYARDIPGFPLLPLQDLSLPVAYSHAFGERDVETRLKLFGLFIQDNIKLRPNLTMKVGLRYDLNRLRFTPDNNGIFSPRLGLVYNPARLPKLTVSLAYGIFAGVQPYGPSLPTGLLATNLRRFFVLPFPNSVIPFSRPTKNLPASETFPTDIEFIPQLSTTAIYDENLGNNYTQQAKLGIDYRVNNSGRVSLNYVMVRGNKLLSARDINPVVRPIPGDELGSQLFGRPDPTKGEMIQTQTAYDSYYHAFTVAVDQRWTNRLNLLAHYTLSKTIDNFVDFTAGIRDDAVQTDVIEPNTGAERGLSLQDARHRFVASCIFELSTINKEIFKGFQLSSIVSMESGRPYNLTRTTSVITSRGSLARPNFRPVGLGRNVGVTPDFATVDLRLTRTFVIKDRYRLQPRVEFFNAFNRVNIRGVNGGLVADGNGNFTLPPKEGKRHIATPEQFVSAFPPRQVQFSLSMVF